MSNMNSMEREQKKRQLKRRIVEPGSAPGGRPGKHQEDNEEEIVRKAERNTRISGGTLCPGTPVYGIYGCLGEGDSCQ